MMKAQPELFAAENDSRDITPVPLRRLIRLRREGKYPEDPRESGGERDRHPDSNSMHPTPSNERRRLIIMEQVSEKNLKTPPESDPRKENRNVPAGSETSLVPEDFDDIRPKDGGTLKPIDEETPSLVGN
jgi:hypothetical protein